MTQSLGVEISIPKVDFVWTISKVTPLADQSHCCIHVNVEEDTEQYLPMTSRLVQLVILDVLAAGVTLRRGEGFTPHLARIKDSLKDTRFQAS